MAEPREGTPTAVLEKPAPQQSDPTKKVLDKLASFNQPPQDSKDKDNPKNYTEIEVKDHKDPYRARLDEIRGQLKEIAKNTAGKKWHQIPQETREEIRDLRDASTTVFYDYYTEVFETPEGVEIMKYINPALSDKELQEAHQAYFDYKKYEAELKGADKSEYQEKKEKYNPLKDQCEEVLKQYRLDGVIEHNPAYNFAREFHSLGYYEFVKMGFPVNNLIKDRLALLSGMRGKEKTTVFRKFFDEDILDRIKQEVDDDAMSICFEERRAYRGADWDERYYAAEPSLAIEYLSRNPTPFVIRRLIAINAFDTRKTDEYGSMGRYTRLSKDNNAMHALLKMKEKGNWDEIVAKTMDTYPELQSIENELRELKINERRLSGEQKDLFELEWRFKNRFMIPLHLGLTSVSDDPQLVDFLNAQSVHIDENGLKDAGILTEEERNAFYRIPSAVKYTDKYIGNKKASILDADLETLHKKDITPDERDRAIASLKKMAFVSKKITESQFVPDEYHLTMNQVNFYKFALTSDLSYDQIEFLVKNYAKFFPEGEVRSGFEQSQPLVGANEHYPLLMRTVLEVNRSAFISVAGADQWRAAFGNEGMKKWKEEAKDKFIETATRTEWTEIYGDEGLRQWALEAPEVFCERAGKQEWKDALGEEVVERFLKALPTESDERRNAFLHNEYDRASQFMEFLLKGNQNYKDFFTFTTRDMEIVAEYVEQFGLSKDLHVFHYFKQLTLLEKGLIKELPADIAGKGIDTKADLLAAMERMKVLAYGEEPILHPSQLTAFELANLRVVTGKASHRFDNGRHSFQEIISDFEKDMEEGRISPLPEGYKPETILLQEVKIKFDSSEVADDFHVLYHDIQKSLRSILKYKDIKPDVKGLLRNKLEKIEETLKEADGKKKEHLEKELSRFQTYYNSLDGVDSMDSLMSAVVAMKMDKSERPEMNGILRGLIFKKIFLQNPHLKDQITSILSSVQPPNNILPQQILSVVDLIKDPIHEHVINVKGGLEEYWPPETAEAMRANKEKLRDIFEPYYSRLKEAVERFQISGGQTNLEIKAIPDRGFIGEMSGYLADVCYTAVYPLLRNREVVPYKFVTVDPVTKLPKFIGSVLVFEVDTEDGEGALMVRGFDVPKEHDYEMSKFIEQFLDKMADLAKQRGKKRVLIPGNTSAMSNYSQTINHFRNYYHESANLSERFDFNGYDLTNNSLVARTVA